MFVVTIIFILGIKQCKNSGSLQHHPLHRKSWFKWTSVFYRTALLQKDIKPVLRGTRFSFVERNWKLDNAIPMNMILVKVFVKERSGMFSSIILAQLSSRKNKLVKKKNYHWGMSSESWHNGCIYKIPEIDEAILRATSYMSIRIGKAAIQFVRLRIIQYKWSNFIKWLSQKVCNEHRKVT